jgi:hypothetical protein
MFKILKAYFLITLLDIEHVHPGYKIGPSIVHRDGCAGLWVKARVTIIFDMALGAKKVGI